MTVLWAPSSASAPTSLTQLTSVGTTYSFFATDWILEPNQFLFIQVKCDNDGGTPTDDAIIGIFTTQDLTSEVWDDDEWDSFFLQSDVDPRHIAFVVRGPFKFRVGVKSTGATDTYTVDGKYRLATES